MGLVLGGGFFVSDDWDADIHTIHDALRIRQFADFGVGGRDLAGLNRAAVFAHLLELFHKDADGLALDLGELLKFDHLFPMRLGDFPVVVGDGARLLLILVELPDHAHQDEDASHQEEDDADEKVKHALVDHNLVVGLHLFYRFLPCFQRSFT